MNKAELVKNAAEYAEMPEKDMQKAFDAIIECIGSTLERGEKIKLIGFGTFNIKHREAREGVNPANKKKMVYPAKYVPSFSAGKLLKDRVRNY